MSNPDPSHDPDNVLPEDLVEKECNHSCSGNCRREGCNCNCGEYHKEPFGGVKKGDYDDRQDNMTCLDNPIV